MRKITERIKEAFDNNISIKIDNSEVIVGIYTTCMYLFDNLIAEKSKEDGIRIRTAGWFSNTTKERLSAFIPIRQEKGDWYYHMNDYWHLWDGSWLRIE